MDSNEEPDQVVQVAEALASMAEGVCEVVMCIDPPSRRGLAVNGGGAPAPLTPESIGAAERKLTALYGDQVCAMVLPGHPVAELRRYARNNQINLIVMGAQGLEVEREYGQRLCDDPPCPVMILILPSNGGERTNTCRKG